MLGNWEQFQSDPTGAGYSEFEDREHSAANELTARHPAGLGNPPAMPFAYDDAGNLRSAYFASWADSLYTHDAWNRLVRQQYNWHGYAVLDHAEYEYNGLHWRTVRRRTGLVQNPAQERVMYYSAAWQLLEERIEDLDESGPDLIGQQVWGPRYIDDAVLRRVIDPQVDGPAAKYYYLTDAQFSSRALITAGGADPQVVERVRYEAYGRGTHRWTGDFNDDGLVNSSDEDMFSDPGHTGNLGTATYNVALDLNRDGVIDASDEALFAQWLAKPAVLAGRISDAWGPDNPIGYAGYVFNSETMLYVARFRWYDPVKGRWMQRDPAGDVDGVHLYQYVRSSPVRYTDWRGASAEEPDSPPPPHLDPNDPRNDPTKGCGIMVRQDDISRDDRHYGHRIIEFSDPGRGNDGEPGYRRPGKKGVGRHKEGGIRSPRPDCDECQSDRILSGQGTGDTEWDVQIGPNARPWYWSEGEYHITVRGNETRKGRGFHYYDDRGVLRFGPAAGTRAAAATCEDIRLCILNYTSSAPYEYLPGLLGGNQCRTEADNILAACGLRKINERRTTAGAERDQARRRREAISQPLFKYTWPF
jgi:RHS repeat-associated protein